MVDHESNQSAIIGTEKVSSLSAARRESLIDENTHHHH